MPKISVIVPVYNAENYLPQCIDSIRRQTLADIEIVCVVDGSTDRSESILRLYEKVEPRLRIIVKPNGGTSFARNVGIDESTAPILMFVDSDDLISPNACEVVYSALTSYNAEALTFGARCYPEFDTLPWLQDVLSPRDIFYPQFSTAILFEEKSRPFIWNTAIKAELLKRAGLRFDETVRFGEDQLFLFEMYPKAKGVLFISKKLYSYRSIRPDSLMATRSADMHKKLGEHIVLTDRVCAAWKRDGLIDKYGSELLDWAADFLIYDCMTAADKTSHTMCAGLEELLPRWFDERDIENMKAGSFAKAFFGRLFKGDFTDEEYAEFKTSYFSAVKSNRRKTLPTFTSEIKRRVKAKLMPDEEFLMSSEKLHWLAIESGACSRSLELLRCELIAKGHL